MAFNAPGASGDRPGAYSETDVISKGVAVPGGVRLAAFIGEGARTERIVSSALGGGNDGFDPTFSSTTGSDGRHFKLSVYPEISNRTKLYRNGVLLTGIEQAGFYRTPGGTFSQSYDYRQDINLGYIELQTAHLVDQGGAYYLPSASNVGNGTINGLTLVDVNAPTETWTVRCVSVRRNGSGVVLDGYGRFIAQGSVSGVILDGYGNVVTWQSNGTTETNGILTFSISDGATPFHEGDNFRIEVRSGALIAGDTLTAAYIGETDLNDPEFFVDPDVAKLKHGSPSTENTLALAAQLGFANGPPGLYYCQAAPPVPRRVSYVLEASASGDDTPDDLEFALPLGVTPDADSKINFFVTDSVTGVETQFIPNKTAFYNSTITATPNVFHYGVGYTYSYTVVMEDAVVKEGDDGVLTRVNATLATLSSTSVSFGQDDLSGTRTAKILTPATNAGTYTIQSVANGVLTIYSATGFTDESPVEFRIIDSAESSAIILFTNDLALAAGASLRATVVDSKDADFFDVGWENAYAALEKIECDIVAPFPIQTISAIFQAGRIHCAKMSNIGNKKERVLFIGAISGLMPNNVIGTEDAAVEDIGVLEGIQGDDVSEILAGNIEDLADYGVQNAYGNTYRVVYFYPDQIVVQIGADRTIVDGFYIAAAAAGYLSGVPLVSIPLTNKVLTGFTILRTRTYDPTTLKRIINAGITLLEPVTGGGNVVWGRTTTNSGIAEDEEISIIFIRDRLSKGVREAFRGFPGNPEDETTQGSMLSFATKYYQSCISSKLITKFRNVKVVRDSVEPRQWNVTAEAQPVYGINWVYIRTSVGLLE